jgi:hypothetical protein
MEVMSVELKKGRQVTELGGYGVKRELRTTRSTAAVYWSPKFNSYVVVERKPQREGMSADDAERGEYQVLSINGLGEIRWALDPWVGGWQCDNEAQLVFDYFFDREVAMDNIDEGMA